MTDILQQALVIAANGEMILFADATKSIDREKATAMRRENFALLGATIFRGGPVYPDAVEVSLIDNGEAT